jgi:periplasmic protein TonB
METKKSFKANLENKKVIFYQLGLVIVLSGVLVAFEWSSVPSSKFLEFVDNRLVEIDLAEVTYQKPKPPAPPPKPIDFVVVNELNPDEIEFVPIDFGADMLTSVESFPTDLPEETADDEPFYKVEDMPKFRGGDLTTFWAYLQSTMRYPSKAIELGIAGTVILQFVVDERGQVTRINLLKGADPLLDEEAIRVLQASPAWEPGRQLGKAVKVAFTIPLKFTLQ